MGKTAIKEIIIGLLLCLAILLILAVLLYSYIPNNKVVPELISYKAPDDAKQILTQSTSDTSQVILTYEVNSSDLTTAQSTNEYNPGKVDPFSTYVVKEETTEGTEQAGNTGTTTDNGTTSTNGSSTSNGTTNSSSSSTNGGNQSTNSSTNGGTYFKDKGTK